MRRFLLTRALPQARSVAALAATRAPLSARRWCSAAARAPVAGSDAAALPRIELFQYEVCPFCHKVRAFLDYLNVPYSVTEVNPFSKAEIAFSENYKKVPIVRVDGEVVTESRDIIDTLYQRLRDAGVAIPAALQPNPESEKQKELLDWAHDSLVLQLPPNIYRSMNKRLLRAGLLRNDAIFLILYLGLPESWEAFSYISKSDRFSTMDKLKVQVGGSLMMWLVGKKLAKKYCNGSPRSSLEANMAYLNGERGAEDYIGGSEPSLADVMAFGVLRSVENMQTGRELLQDEETAEWYGKMKKLVGESSAQRL